MSRDPVGCRLATPVLAGEQARRERHERDEPDAHLLGRRDQLGLGAAVQQVVPVLRGHERRRAGGPGAPVGVHHLPRREVRRAEVPDLALDDELVQGGERLLDGRHGVGDVHLEQVDVIGAEPAQRALDGAPHVAARPAHAPVGTVQPAGVHAELASRSPRRRGAPPRAAPSSSSLWPGTPPYTSAVSKNVMPASSAAATSAGTSCGGERRAERVAPEARDGDDETAVAELSEGHLGAGARGWRDGRVELLTRATLSLSPAHQVHSRDLHVLLEHWRGDHR